MIVMKLFDVITASLLIFTLGPSETESISCTASHTRYGRPKSCYGVSTHCCPNIKYSRTHFGTTFSTCCPYSRYSSVKGRQKTCSNPYASKLFCYSRSTYCCSTGTYMNGAWRSGCCTAYRSKSTTKTGSSRCVTGPEKATICGMFSSCCLDKKYAKSYRGTTFGTCCSSRIWAAPSKTCKNDYETYWCKSPASNCCSSLTSISGKWHTSCCVGSGGSAGGGSGGGWQSGTGEMNVSALVGGIVGAFVFVVVFSVVSFVIISRRRTRFRL